ncbi:MAG TPA: hypothetical protein VMR99_01545 [Candidatus Paceibacterota bacterium]|nr:hypothetical protein [Candidatus Paceibacterota bacterium]
MRNRKQAESFAPGLWPKNLLTRYRFDENIASFDEIAGVEIHDDEDNRRAREAILKHYAGLQQHILVVVQIAGAAAGPALVVHSGSDRVNGIAKNLDFFQKTLSIPGMPGIDQIPDSSRDCYRYGHLGAHALSKQSPRTPNATIGTSDVDRRYGANAARPFMFQNFSAAHVLSCELG